MKKLLAVLLATLMLCGAMAVGASAAAGDTYPVTYNGNGAGAANVPPAQTKNEDEPLTLRTEVPTRPNYTFLGWSASPTAAAADEAYKPGASYTANAALALYAVWRADTFVVRYRGNAAFVRGVPRNQAKTADMALTLTTQIPTRRGYEFVGWSTAPGGAVAYAPGDTYNTNSGITLYAIWNRLPDAEQYNPLYHIWWLFLWFICFGWYWM